MSVIERRSEERFSLEIPTHIKILKEQKKKPTEYITKDVCAGGAFFHTNMPIQVGTAVKVDLLIPIYKSKKTTSEKVMIKVDGKVIRTHSSGMAVRFDKKYEIIPIRN